MCRGRRGSVKPFYLIIPCVINGSSHIMSMVIGLINRKCLINGWIISTIVHLRIESVWTFVLSLEKQNYIKIIESIIVTTTLIWKLVVYKEGGRGYWFKTIRLVSSSETFVLLPYQIWFPILNKIISDVQNRSFSSIILSFVVSGVLNYHFIEPLLFSYVVEFLSTEL